MRLSFTYCGLSSLLFLLDGSGWAQTAAQPDRARALTSVQQVLSLSRDEADRSHPANVRGIVVFSSGSGRFVLQSGRAGVVVDHGHGDFRPGDEVEVHGVTQAGCYAPYIRPTSIQKLGNPGLPQPARIGTSALMRGRHLYQRIEIRAQVVAVETSPRDGPPPVSSACTNEPPQRPERQTELVVRAGPAGQQFRAILRDSVDPAPQHLIEAWVRLVSVGGVALNLQGQYLGPLLHLASLRDIVVERPAPKDPFDRPPTPVEQLLQYGNEHLDGSRVKLRGVVSLARPPGVFYLEDHGRGVAVYIRQASRLVPGDVVETVGFPRPGVRIPHLEHAILRTLRRSSPPQPQDMTPVQAVSDAADGRLIRVEGFLVGRRSGDGFTTLFIQAGRRNFEAEIPAAVPVRHLPQPGSWLRVSGVCQVLIRDGETEATSFRLLTRALHDVRTVREATASTVAHLPAAFTFLLGALALGGAAFLLTRERVRGQSTPQTAPLPAAEDSGQPKSELMASISHELRTPLHGLLGMAQLVSSIGQSENSSLRISRRGE